MNLKFYLKAQKSFHEVEIISIDFDLDVPMVLYKLVGGISLFEDPYTKFFQLDIIPMTISK